MLPIKIIRQYHQSELTQGGNIRRLVRVDFLVGEDGPFNVSIPESDYTADALLAKVNEIAGQVAQLRQATAPGTK